MFKLNTFGGLHMQNTHTLNKDKRRYQGVKNLLILVYLALEDKRFEMPQLAKFIFVENKDPQNSFDRALSNLKTGLDFDIMLTKDGQGTGKKRRRKLPLPYFLEEGLSPRNRRTLKLAKDYVTAQDTIPTKANKPSLYIDCFDLERACRAGDIAHIRTIYHGPFLDGFEEEVQAPKPKYRKLSNAKQESQTISTYLEWVQGKRVDFANAVLEQVVHTLEQHSTGHLEAEILLDFLLETHDVKLFSAGFLAYAYTLLPATKQPFLRDTLITVLRQQPEQGYLHVLYSMALQQKPSLSLACSACQLNAEDYAQLEIAFVADDWINDSNPDRLIGGHALLKAALEEPNQRSIKYALLHKLFSLTPEQNHAELFHLAWSYQQDTGNFGDMAWSKICQVLVVKVGEYCRYGEFVKAQEICEAWESARVQREEKTHEDLHFYHAYSLERQSLYQQAWQVLARQLHVKSIRHQVLQVCLHERMSTLELSEMQIQHLYPHIAGMLERENDPQKILDSLYQQTGLAPHDDWARAEIYSIKGRLAFQKQDYGQAIHHFRSAMAGWQECHEPYRALGLHNNIACAYDNANDFNAALAEYQVLDRALQKYPELAQLVFRSQLNQIILCDNHEYEPFNNISQRYRQLIDVLRQYEENSFPDILGKTLYNYGYCQQKMGHFQNALQTYQQAIPILSRNKDKVTFGCSYGQSGNCYYQLLQNVSTTALHNDKQGFIPMTHEQELYQNALASNAQNALQTAIDILERIGNPYAEDYRKTLQKLERYFPV